MLKLLLCIALRRPDWSCVLNENSVDSAVNNLTAIIREAINLAISHRKSKNSTFHHWFSNSLKYYIKKKNQHFRKYKISKYDHNWLKPPLNQTGFVG
jgi:hypothetical protein